MDHRHHPPVPAAPWQLLLAPFPAEAAARRRPMGSPEVLARPEGAAIAGWEQLVVELSAGVAGLRVAMVVLDATGQPISASDMVLYRTEIASGGEAAGTPSVIEFYHESIGGRLEPDGTFLGTRWRSVRVEGADEETLEAESTSSEPSAADVAGITALVAEILRRAAARGG